MKKVAVIYKSKYGNTKQYAEWISEELGCDLIEASEADGEILSNYDIIVYGGGLYASGIYGISLITKNFEALKGKNIIVFTVGLADPNIKSQFEPILDKNFAWEIRKNIDIFHLRGGINYKELGLLHKSMMAMMKKTVEKKQDNEKTDEDRMMLDTYGTAVDFKDKNTIGPICECVRAYMAKV